MKFGNNNTMTILFAVAFLGGTTGGVDNKLNERRKKMNEIYCPNCDCVMEAGSCCPDCGTQDYTEVNND